WTDALAQLPAMGGSCVLVTVAYAKGSTPRETGAKMVVAASNIYGTIGGGNLEYLAIEEARELLSDNSRQQAYVEYPLGPKLGQCCGGKVGLLFERLSAMNHSWFSELANAQQQRRAAVLVTLLEPKMPQKFVVTESRRDGLSSLAPQVLQRALYGLQTAATHFAQIYELGEQRFFLEYFSVDEFNVVVFGAGHVGRAVVAALSPLCCDILWIDCRAKEFPQQCASNVSMVVSDKIVGEVESATSGAYFLVMTHSHQLDLELCERILRRNDFAYLGLIGSHTKRQKFMRRLAANGCTQDTLQRLTCPIGVSGISGKRPGEIAVAVAAQILHVKEAATAQRVDLEKATPIRWPMSRKIA
ncbi:MAG: xanthine dehydrogenase accessory protein XdhC, partial [Gammaproteobacteria bacterium]|nr:xanthine dehydrogenase accessory protein XdhC [Gammaproteobacteria bacterium]